MQPGSHSDRWSEIDAVFREALDMDPAAWPRFLEERCGGDPDLLESVSDLLEADRGAAAFLDASAEEVAPGEFAEALRAGIPDTGQDRTGERVGAFRVARHLGRGGMAGVYLAERADGEFAQRVAVKFFAAGSGYRRLRAPFPGRAGDLVGPGPIPTSPA